MSGFDGKNFIGGEWRPAASGRRFEQRNPAFLHEVTGTFADSAAADVDAAIAAAQAAFPVWRALSPLKRKVHLDRALHALTASRDDSLRLLFLLHNRSLDFLARADRFAAGRHATCCRHLPNALLESGEQARNFVRGRS